MGGVWKVPAVLCAVGAVGHCLGNWSAAAAAGAVLVCAALAGSRRRPRLPATTRPGGGPSARLDDKRASAPLPFFDRRSVAKWRRAEERAPRLPEVRPRHQRSRVNKTQ